MASIIRIKRSSGTSIPASLNWGELAYVTGIGSATGTNQRKDRIYIGDDGSNVISVGGRYYTSMMDHVPGTIAGVTNTRNSDSGIVAVLAPANNTCDSTTSLKVDQWNVDNLRLDTNTLSSTNTDGDIILDPCGSGEILIPDDTFLTLGNDRDAKIEYDENDTNRVLVTGAEWDFRTAVSITGGTVIDCVGISSNVIRTKPGCGNVLYLDPYPDGLSNEGTVVIKGSLQVDGTTTSVNSTVSTLNDPIIHVGDVTSERTVMTPVVAGVSTIRLDYIVGINTGDVVSGSTALSLSGLSTVTSYDTVNNIITIQDTVLAPGISTTTQLTVTHGFDTNTDRGLSFSFNTSSGTSNNKTGFFGMQDSSIASSTAGTLNHGTHADDSRRWTYVPDATISNSVVSGTKGFLDVKGIYYQSGDFNTNGVVFFDNQGLQRSTNDPASPVVTSKQVLTAITKNTLSLGSAITVTAGDIVRQDTTGAYGIVESSISGGTSLDLIGVEGVFNTTDNLRLEGDNGTITNLSSIPSTVTVIYTNKPTWTSTVDGGTY